MDRSNIEKIAKSAEDKVLLAKVWDKIHSGIQKNIPAHSCFLSPRELDMTKYLFGSFEGLSEFGGYPNAERKMLVYLPDYLDESFFYDSLSPLTCIRASFYEKDTLSHRDFLGSLMGAGIARETIGDICVHEGSCDFFLTTEIAPYVMQNLTSAGRTKLQLAQIRLYDFCPPEENTLAIKDTVSSLRLDSILSSGFRIGRNAATQYIASGRAAVDGLPCLKPDKILQEGNKISVRGLGKIQLNKINGQTKKGRISIEIHRYI